MAYIGNTDYYSRVAGGDVEGSSIMSAMGERESIGTTVSGEDVWRYSGNVIGVPQAIGDLMTIQSTKAADGVAGTGVIEVRIHYIDVADGLEKTVDVLTNGTTTVNIPTIRALFVNDMYSIDVGSGGVADGEITVFQTGVATNVFNVISAGGNKSMVPAKMVPTGYELILKGWHATEAQGKRCAIRIRSTDMNNELLAGVFGFKDTVYLSKSSSGNLPLNVRVPALSIVKISAWAVVNGAEVGCGWWGELKEL